MQQEVEQLKGEIEEIKKTLASFSNLNIPLETINVLKRFFPTVLYTTASLDFGNLAAQGSADLTIALTGAMVGDPVALAIPNTVMGSGNPTFFAWVSSDGVITVRYVNAGSSATNPASGTFNVAVIKRNP